MSKSTCVGGALIAIMLLVAALPMRADDFDIRDGDTVVFLGDSITAARIYGRIIEDYTLLRYPRRNVKFHNAGWGGDTAAGGLKRLERDVFSKGATLLTVAYGVNDIGWGLYADEAHRKVYLESIRGIVEACRQRGVRVYICSAAITAMDPDAAEEGFLQKMCDEGMAISRSLGGGAIDVQRSMREVQRRVIAHNKNIQDPTKRTALHVSDGTHLNDLGQLAMAFAILKGLGAPAEVSSLTLDAAGAAVIDSAGCEVSDVSVQDQVLSFTRLDEGLPLNHGLFFALNFLYVPIHNDLARYMLAVKNLPPGRYDVSVDGVKIATYSAPQLAAGVNIAFATESAWHPGGPWAAQANSLLLITEARSQINVAATLAHAQLPEGILPGDYALQSDQADEQLVALQRLIAHPQPYHFRIEPAAEPKK